MRKSMKAHLACSAAALVIALPSASYAQQASQDTAESREATEINGQEIVVTARSGKETLMTVPVAVSAVSGENLQKLAITDSRELAKLVPSLGINQTSNGAGGNIAVRGVSSNGNQAGFDQAVSINIDGVQVGRPRALAAGLFDIAQVEVLEGPQALFFGKSSSAGVLSIKSAGPTPTLKGYVRSQYEIYASELFVDGAISGPITDALGFRVAGRLRFNDGFYKNRAGQLTPAQAPFAPPEGLPTLRENRPEHEQIGRLTLSYSPSASPFQATLKLSASHLTGPGAATGTQYQSCGLFNAPTFSPVPSSGVGYEDPYGNCKADRAYSNSAPSPALIQNYPLAKAQPYKKATVYLAVFQAAYEFEGLNLTSTTGLFRLRYQGFDNLGFNSFFQFPRAEKERYSSFSQEVRAVTDFDGPINLAAGLYYQDADLNYFSADKVAAAPADPTPGVNFGKFHSFERFGYTHGKTYSAFGQIIIKPLPEIEIAGGARYTYEKKISQMGNTYVNPALLPRYAPVGKLFDDKFTDSNISPEATVSWKPNPDSTLYLAYKTGFKSGGFGISSSLTPTGISKAALQFKSETVKGFEAGLKIRAFDGLFTGVATLYSFRYSNLQTTSYNVDLLALTITNAASARVKGVQLQASIRPAAGLSFNGAVAYNRARFGAFLAPCYGKQTLAQGCLGAQGQDVTGRTLQRAPEWVLNGGFDYQTSMLGDWRLGLNGNARYSSSYLLNDNLNPSGRQTPYWQVDAGIRLIAPNDRWEISLLGKNLTNEFYVFSASEAGDPRRPGDAGTPSQFVGTASRGRQILVGLSFNY